MIEIENNKPKGPVTILGQAYFEETLIARPNGVGDADGIDYDTETFQWLRDGEEIAGATSRTYNVTDADIGAQLSVRYTYMDFGGTLEVLTSDPETAVPPAGTPIPEDTGPYNPLIVLGDALVGERLTARPNAVFDKNGIDDSTITYQWLRNGEVIPGATEQSYDVTEADVSAKICVVFAYDDLLGTPKSLTSNEKPEVAIPDDFQFVLDDADEGVEEDVDEVTEGADEAVEEDVDEATEIVELVGTSDDDLLIATAGLEWIKGHDGTDTAFFSGDQSHYSLVLGKDGVSVSDHRTDGFGAIALDSIELIDFDVSLGAVDGPINLDSFRSHTDLNAEDLFSIVEMYIAYFNRAPDALGLNFWGTAFANGTSLEEMAALFADQDETREPYTDDTDNTDFVTAIYKNVLGRDVDQAGLEFWVSALDQDALARNQFVLKVLQGAKSELKVEEGSDFVDLQLADRAYLENKVDIGAYFSVHKGMSDLENALAVMDLYNGSQESVDDAVAVIDGYYSDALDPTGGEFLLQLVGVLDDPFAA
ncbi:DUF4214 domain-containing protein [Marivita sp. S2033]|uniref:DUF4214 domain-containing protein n=1 Tax=Marivita sp. S2033 TaxID=3373187 RepID=UPI003982BD57